MANEVNIVFALTSGFVSPRWLRKHKCADKRHSGSHT
jgi:hypothetical protein